LWEIETVVAVVDGMVVVLEDCEGGDINEEKGIPWPEKVTFKNFSVHSNPTAEPKDRNRGWLRSY